MTTKSCRIIITLTEGDLFLQQQGFSWLFRALTGILQAHTRLPTSYHLVLNRMGAGHGFVNVCEG